LGPEGFGFCKKKSKKEFHACVPLKSKVLKDQFRNLQMGSKANNNSFCFDQTPIQKFLSAYSSCAKTKCLP
jgi:hypothetical protein